MKFDQLIQYNMKNISVEKSYKKCAGETIPRPVDLWISSVKFQTVCFYCMLIWELSKYSEIKLQTTCFNLI